jgi:predicted Zn-dependent peptidase
MEHGVDEKELSRAKKSVITALELETESTMSQMSANGKAVLFGIDCDVESLKQKYMNVTNEDIISAARFAFSSGKAPFAVFTLTIKKPMLSFSCFI